MDTQNSLRDGLLTVVLPAYNEQDSVPPGGRYHLSSAGRKRESGTRFSLSTTAPGTAPGRPSRPRLPGILRCGAVCFPATSARRRPSSPALPSPGGDCTVVMDCDFQHPPEKILDMYRLWQQGWQVVEGVKISRGKESPLHTLAARPFTTSSAGPPGSTCPAPLTSSCWTGGRWMSHRHAGEERLLPGPVLLDRLQYHSGGIRSPAPSRGGVQVVPAQPLPVCPDQYRRLFHRAPCSWSPCWGWWCFCAPGGAGHLVPVAEDQRTGSGGLYHRHPAPAAHWEHPDVPLVVGATRRRAAGVVPAVCGEHLGVLALLAYGLAKPAVHGCFPAGD